MPEKLEPAAELFRVYDKKTGTPIAVNIYPKGYISGNTSYQIDVSSITVILDQKGKCLGFEQDLPREMLESYYEKLKAYIPKK